MTSETVQIQYTSDITLRSKYIDRQLCICVSCGILTPHKRTKCKQMVEAPVEVSEVTKATPVTEDTRAATRF